MGRNEFQQHGLEQRQSDAESAAKRHFQRGVIVFNQGFGEVFAVFGKDGEIRGDIEGNGK